jgi:lysophospholipase L1-like esterase
MLDRLDDVLASGPTPQVVVILGGTNDIAPWDAGRRRACQPANDRGTGARLRTPAGARLSASFGLVAA